MSTASPTGPAPAWHHWRLLQDSEIQRIHDIALGFLKRVGYRIPHRPILERLEAKGCQVDHPSSTVRLPDDAARRLESCARRNARPPAHEPLLRRPLPRTVGVGHNYTCYYDLTEGRRRPATLDDVRRVVKAWHMMPQITHTGPCMTAQDVPTRIEPIVSYAEVMKLTPKVGGAPEMMLAGQLPYLEELRAIQRGRAVRFHSSGCSVNRFSVDGRAADCLWAVHRRGGLRDWWVNSCPVAGVTAPVTLAGTVAVGVAETIGGWLAGWACGDEVTLGAIPLSGVVDMRSGSVLFSTPETIAIDSALHQFFREVYGIDVGLCIGYTDAKVPGLQALNDKLLKSLAYGWFTDHVGGQTGTLAAGNIYSPTQQVLDLELNRQTAQLARGIEVNEALLAADLIEHLAADPNGVFLTEDHTQRHWRDQLWIPRLLDRAAGWDSPPGQADARVLRQAEQTWRDALASYTPPELDKQTVRAIDEVVRRARAHLLG